MSRNLAVCAKDGTAVPSVSRGNVVRCFFPEACGYKAKSGVEFLCTQLLRDEGGMPRKGQGNSHLERSEKALVQGD